MVGYVKPRGGEGEWAGRKVHESVCVFVRVCVRECGYVCLVVVCASAPGRAWFP